MPSKKTGAAGRNASPKTREIASQDATADDGSLATEPGATSKGVVDGVAGTGGSSGAGADREKIDKSGEVSGIKGIDEDDSDDPEADDDRGPASGTHGVGGERNTMSGAIRHPNRQSTDNDPDVSDKRRGTS